MKIILPKSIKSQLRCFLVDDNESTKQAALALAEAATSFFEDVPIFVHKFDHRANIIIGASAKLNLKADNDCKRLYFPVSSQLPEYIPGNPLDIKVKNKLTYINTQILYFLFNEIRKYSDGGINSNKVIQTLRELEKFLRPLTDHKSRKRAITLFTIDSEDQHNYFNNKQKRCTDINGSKIDLQDMRFNNALACSLERLNKFNIHPTFMVTGSEISNISRDGFGNPLLEIDKNIRELKKISADKNVSIAFHSFNHQEWLKFGKSGNEPMSIWGKLSYFFSSGGNVRLLGRYIKGIWRLRHLEKEKLGEKGDFISSELKRQFQGLEDLYRKHNISFTKFFRSPGFRRSKTLIKYLNDNQFTDSSDILSIDPIVAPLPYYLFVEDGREISLSLVKEFPCFFIDRYLRTTKKSELDKCLKYLRAVYSNPDSVLTIVTHTKVTGSNFNHCHIYPRNPKSGLAQPPIEKNLEKVYTCIREHSSSLSFKEYLKTEAENGR